MLGTLDSTSTIQNTLLAMLSLRTLAALRFSSAAQSNNALLPARAHPTFPSSLQSKRKKPPSPLKYQFGADDSQTVCKVSVAEEEKELRGPKEEDEVRGRMEEKAINGIHVPRQKYISISKAELLDAVVSMFEVKEEADEFVQLSRCLDSILHAEHKGMLEKMRIYYSLTHSQKQKATDGYSSVRPKDVISTGQHLAPDDFLDSGNRGANYYKNEDNKTLNFPNSLDFRHLFASFAGTASTNASVESRASMANDFQHSFMKLLHDAQFEELSAQDLLWTYALNSDYLLTLPIYVDWKKASESNAIIFRRGYATQKERGLLLAEKLDYLQSKLLQAIFFSLSRPLKITGSWLNEVLKSSTEAQGVQNWIEKLKLWLKERYSVENTLAFPGNISSDQLESDELADSDLPIWLAAQRAIPRYEGFLSSAGPRGRLVRKLLIWTGIIPSLPETSVNLDSDTKHAEAYLRPNFLPRVTLSNIWEPATKESCGNDVWKMLKSSVSILFSSSTLQEPAFQELILLYNEESSLGESRDIAAEIPLQLKIYESIPIPELPVIFPHKKLSFRILDTVRLDVASILGLLAFFVNYKFENIASSPSAILLDVIAFSALVIYVSRIVLGYKQTWDRYQLLVNKTLYEKTLASGFGSVHFLLDASEQQQYKEAILVYATLLRSEKYQVSCRESIKDACERFMYDKFKEKIEMPIEKAVNTLLRLDLLYECSLDGNLKLKAIPSSEGRKILRKRWDYLLGQDT